MAIAAAAASIPTPPIHKKIQIQIQTCASHLEQCRSPLQGRALHANLVKLGASAQAAKPLLQMYARHGLADEAFAAMQLHDDCDRFSISSLLKACSVAAERRGRQGEQLHCLALKLGFHLDAFVATSLIEFYSRCQRFDLACRAFFSVPVDVVACNAMISASSRHGKFLLGFSLFLNMIECGLRPSRVSLGLAVGLCGKIGKRNLCREIHGFVLKSGFGCNGFVASGLVAMYEKVREMEFAQKVFDRMSRVNDLNLYNILVWGFARRGLQKDAVMAFLRLLRDAMKPDKLSFAAVLSACGDWDVDLGRQIHALSVKSSLGCSIPVCSSLVAMYSRCGMIDDARLLFERTEQFHLSPLKILFSNSSMNVRETRPSQIFRKLFSAKSPVAEGAQLVSGNRAATSTEIGSQQSVWDNNVDVPREFSIAGFSGNYYTDSRPEIEAVLGSSCNDREHVVIWTAMIAAYVQNELWFSALELFVVMQCIGIKPNHFSYSAILTACAGLACLEEGRQVHVHILKIGVDSDVFFGSGLVDMYFKCGKMEDAQMVFSRMPRKDNVAWNAMIAGYTKVGHEMRALQTFEEMQRSAMKPNAVTFMSVLRACRKGGFVELGLKYFDIFIRVYGLVPSDDHYVCMYELLSRFGKTIPSKKLASRDATLTKSPDIYPAFPKIWNLNANAFFF